MQDELWQKIGFPMIYNMTYFIVELLKYDHLNCGKFCLGVLYILFINAEPTGTCMQICRDRNVTDI